MKKVFKSFGCLLILGLVFPFMLISCKEEKKEYNGAEIVLIEYIVVDFMEGATYYKKLDLTSGTVYTRDFYPWLDTEVGEYELAYSFDTQKNKEIIDEFYNIGILELEELYSDYDVCDGGSWELIIEYRDGSQKRSMGINAGPTELFRDVDYAFYEITGKSFFQYD